MLDALALLATLTVYLCAPHPLHPETDICEPRYSQSYADEALCERAADRGGDGLADQVWIDLATRLAEPAQHLLLRCPMRAYRAWPAAP